MGWLWFMSFYCLLSTETILHILIVVNAARVVNTHGGSDFIYEFVWSSLMPHWNFNHFQFDRNDIMAKSDSYEIIILECWSIKMDKKLLFFGMYSSAQSYKFHKVPVICTFILCSFLPVSTVKSWYRKWTTHPTHSSNYQKNSFSCFIWIGIKLRHLKFFSIDLLTFKAVYFHILVWEFQQNIELIWMKIVTVWKIITVHKTQIDKVDVCKGAGKIKTKTINTEFVHSMVWCFN